MLAAPKGGTTLLILASCDISPELWNRTSRIYDHGTLLIINVPDNTLFTSQSSRRNWDKDRPSVEVASCEISPWDRTSRNCFCARLQPIEFSRKLRNEMTVTFTELYPTRRSA